MNFSKASTGIFENRLEAWSPVASALWHSELGAKVRAEWILGGLCNLKVQSAKVQNSGFSTISINRSYRARGRPRPAPAGERKGVTLILLVQYSYCLRIDLHPALKHFWRKSNPFSTRAVVRVIEGAGIDFSYKVATSHVVLCGATFTTQNWTRSPLIPWRTPSHASGLSRASSPRSPSHAHLHQSCAIPRNPQVRAHDGELSQKGFFVLHWAAQL